MNTSDPAPQPKEQVDPISLALDRLWARFLPEIMQRIAVIESAVDAVDSNCCTDDLRHQTHLAAHKLAGSLGTFGLPQGTEMARFIEQAFAPAENPTSADSLRRWIKQIRVLVENR